MENASLEQAEPSARLAPWISSYWLYRQNTGQNRKLRFLPTGCSLIVLPVEGDVSWEGPSGGESVREGLAFGPRHEWFDIVLDPGSVVIMVHLEEGGLRRFAGKAASAALRSAVPLSALGLTRLNRAVDVACGRFASPRLGLGPAHGPSDRDAPSLRLSLVAPATFATIDQYFDSLYEYTDSIDPKYCSLVSSLVERPEITKVRRAVEALDLSAAGLDRAVRSVTGLSPKEFLMISRGHALYSGLVRATPSRHFVDLALELGYYDQAHAIHDLARSCGFTPSFLRAQVRADEVEKRIGFSHVKETGDKGAS